tara:strand:+ start:1575 stop:1940 length:366 start_codon:yes stop_codon:yes gene_type:complete
MRSPRNLRVWKQGEVMRKFENSNNELLLDTGEVWTPVWRENLDGSYTQDQPLLSNGDVDWDLINYEILNPNDCVNDKYATYIKNKERQDKLGWEQKTKGIGRNSKCPCGSGKKYKKCCLTL